MFPFHWALGLSSAPQWPPDRPGARGLHPLEKRCMHVDKPDLERWRRVSHTGCSSEQRRWGISAGTVRQNIVYFSK